MIDYKIVEKLKDPFFLVIGAMDGISHDNLAPYIRKKRMSGIFIEPVKYMFNKLKINYQEFEGIRFENCAITESDGFSMIKRIDFDNISNYPSWSDGGSSLLPEKTAMKNISGLIEEQIETKTLKTLFSKYPDLNKIDIIQIDCEGYDLTILKQIDLNKYRPYFISIEILSMSNIEIHETDSILRNNGYETINNGSEILAINENNLL
jgi:FkbM family methyltransferase